MNNAAVISTLRRTGPRVALGLAALASLAAAAWTTQFGFVVFALVAVLLLATSISAAGRLTGDLQPFLGRAVEVLVWGARPSATDGAIVTLVSVQAFGAGLHFYFQVGAGTSTRHLKVAQPSGTRVTGDRLVIETARYVQWGGKRLPAVPGVPALTVRGTAFL
jgi:hypothetical protein